MCNVLCTVQCTYSVLYSAHCTSVQYKTAFFFSLLGSCVRVIMCKQIRLFTVFITRQTHFPISVPPIFFSRVLAKVASENWIMIILLIYGPDRNYLICKGGEDYIS